MQAAELIRAFLAALRVVAFYLFSAIVLPATALALLVRPHTSFYYSVGKIWIHGLLAILRVRLEVHGASRIPAGGDYVFVVNHRSYLDPPAIVAAASHLETRWVAKKELRRIPLLGTVMAVTGQIFIDREDKDKAVRELQRHEGARGVTVVFFPEGRRSVSGELLPFKLGGAAFAIRTGLPVVPVAISGAEQCLAPGHWLAYPGRVRVTFGEPIPVDGLGPDDRTALTDRARRAMEAMLAEMESGPEMSDVDV